jgi:transposase
MFAGLDVSLKTTVICVLDCEGSIRWRGSVLSRPEEIAGALEPWRPFLELVGLETGSLSPFLYHGLADLELPVVCLDARHAADAVKGRRVKSDNADALALAEMLRAGWYSAVHVKSRDAHRIKALLGARDQLVRVKRSLGNQVRGLLRPFGIRVGSRQGTKRFAAAVEDAVRDDPVLWLAVKALLDGLFGIEAQLAKLDEALLDIAKRSEVCWRLMSVPGVGPITALAFMATIDDVRRFSRMRDIGAYLGLTPRRYQSGEADARYRCLSRPDAETLSVWGNGYQAGDQPPRGRHGPALPVRSRWCGALHGAQTLGAEELGARFAQAPLPQAGAGGGGPQAGRFARPDLARSHSFRCPDGVTMGKEEKEQTSP